MGKIDIVIATKDRPNYLNILLKSLVDSSEQISQIIIVSSGVPVDYIIKNYLKVLNINYIKSSISNQSYQKKLGVDSLTPNDNWVLFLDDDVIVPSRTINLLVSKYLSNQTYENVCGIGLSLSKNPSRSLPFLLRIFLSFVGLYSSKPGKILRSGHAQEYRSSTREVKTQWLNGLSIWKKVVAKSYQPINTEESYSAYEDVHFSYRVSKEHALLFAPKLIVFDQNPEESSRLNCAQYEAGYRMRYQFVSLHEELSMLNFRIAQLIRAIWFISKPNKEGLAKRFKVAIKTII
jgi:glycosyltransferase involved in cell wall biosynthesis